MPMRRYSALLLFQYRTIVNRRSSKRRLCEERIIHFRSPTARRALATAKRRGRISQHGYRDEEGHKVYFEFIGVMELRHMGSECESDEVWYELVHRVLPKERKSRFIPAERELEAIRNEY